MGVLTRRWGKPLHRRLPGCQGLRLVSVALRYLLLLSIAVAMAAPLVWMILASFKTSAELDSIVLRFLPQKWIFANYPEMAQRFDFGLYFRNSLVVTTLSVISQVLVSSWIGFVFAKFDFAGSRVLFLAILATMMVPGTVTIIPSYLLCLKLEMLDTLWVLFVPGIVTPFGIFLMRQFIATVPDALIDAARVDGCSDVRIYWQIILPSITPAISALAIFVFIASWDSFLWPLLALSRATWRTLPIGLAFFAEEHFKNTNLAMAGAVVSTAPVLVVYLFLQREFVQGISLTGMASY